MSILSFFSKRDEICGEWHTEDGSGFSMIMGSWIEFKSNGKGNYESWSNSEDDTGYKFSGEISWKRIDKNKIEIRDLTNSTKEIINYKIQKVNNRIELSNLEKKKVGSVEMEEFWNFAQIMFRQK